MSAGWLAPTCGLERVVSGAGARVSRLPGRGPIALHEDATEAGFFGFEIARGTLVGEVCGVDGHLAFGRTLRQGAL